MDGRLSAQAMEKLQGPIAAWLRKLSPSETLSERPSNTASRHRLKATAGIRSCIHRESQWATHPPSLGKKKQASLEGSFRCSPRPPVKWRSLLSICKQSSLASKAESLTSRLSPTCHRNFSNRPSALTDHVLPLILRGYMRLKEVELQEVTYG